MFDSFEEKRKAIDLSRVRYHLEMACERALFYQREYGDLPELTMRSEVGSERNFADGDRIVLVSVGLEEDARYAKPDPDREPL